MTDIALQERAYGWRCRLISVGLHTRQSVSLPLYLDVPGLVRPSSAYNALVPNLQNDVRTGIAKAVCGKRRRRKQDLSTRPSAAAAAVQRGCGLTRRGKAASRNTGLRGGMEGIQNAVAGLSIRGSPPWVSRPGQQRIDSSATVNDDDDESPTTREAGCSVHVVLIPALQPLRIQKQVGSRSLA